MKRMSLNTAAVLAAASIMTPAQSATVDTAAESAVIAAVMATVKLPVTAIITVDVFGVYTWGKLAGKTNPKAVTRMTFYQKQQSTHKNGDRIPSNEILPEAIKAWKKRFGEMFDGNAPIYKIVRVTEGDFSSLDSKKAR